MEKYITFSVPMKKQFGKDETVKNKNKDLLIA